jgi:hypothetical protein
MSIFGEFNVFRPAEAQGIVEKASRALDPGGILLLEPHTFEAVEEIGRRAPSWYSADGGLFSDRPHLCLQESVWDELERVAVKRYYVVDASSGEVIRHSSSMQAYTDEEYRAVLKECGMNEVAIYRSLEAWGEGPSKYLMVILSRKGEL